MLREVNPKISLHYWDWTTDPRASPDGRGGVENLFTTDFMGVAVDDAGSPFDATKGFTSNEGSSNDPRGINHPVPWRNVADAIGMLSIYPQGLCN